MSILVNYDFHKRVITIILDNASINNIVIKLMHPLLREFHDELFYIRFGCYISNLIVKDGLELVYDPINKIRSSIIYLSNSSIELLRLRFFAGFIIKDRRFLDQTNYIGRIPPM